MNEILNSKVAVDRLQNFLSSADIDMSYIKHSQATDPHTALKLTNGTFSWIDENAKPAEQPQSPKKSEGKRGGQVELEMSAGLKKSGKVGGPILKDINMEVKTGSFVAILGE